MTETSEQFRDRKRSQIKPVVLRGFLGWGNRKSGLETYGPGGRWEGEGYYAKDGDLLGDALDRAGAHEGATLLVVAIDRFGDTTLLDHIETFIDHTGETLPLAVENELDPLRSYVRPTAEQIHEWLMGDDQWTDDREHWLAVVRDVLDAQAALIRGETEP